MPRIIAFWRNSGWYLRLLLGLSLLGLGLSVYGWANHPGPVFWDLDVYRAAGDVARAGQDAYAQGYPRLRFVYAPIVLWLFASLGAALKPLLLIGYAAICVWFLRSAPGSIRLALLLVFGVLLGQDLVLRAALTGNVTFYAHLLIVMLWISPATRRRDLFLLLTIALAAAIKPYFAAYFMLWGLRDGRLDRHSLHAAAALTGVIAIWLAQAMLAPDSFAGFLDALHAQTGLNRDWPDFGFGVFRIALFLSPSNTAALIVHGLFSLALLAGWLIWLRRPLARAEGADAKLLLLTGPLVICLAINPRFKLYDMVPFYMLCIHATYLWGRVRPALAMPPVFALMLGIFVIEALDMVFDETGLMRAIDHGGRLALMLGGFVLAARALPTHRTRAGDV